MTSTQSNDTILPVGKATAMIMALTPPGLAFWPATGVPLALKTLASTNSGDSGKGVRGDNGEVSLEDRGHKASIEGSTGC